MKTLESSKKGSKPYSGASAPITSWSCSRIRDPRIVGVSRAFGRKDRHSKVCTVKGLRDRRVRLSIPTAMQLYDLQHRLGLSQPSKVVDWLMNAAKKDIDELPPLQIPPGSFVSPSFQTLIAPISDKPGGGFKVSGSSWPPYAANKSVYGGCLNPSTSSCLRWGSPSLSLSHPPSSKEEDWQILHWQQSLIYHQGITPPTSLRFGQETESERAAMEFNITENFLPEENLQSKDHPFLTR